MITIDSVRTSVPSGSSRSSERWSASLTTPNAHHKITPNSQRKSKADKNSELKSVSQRLPKAPKQRHRQPCDAKASHQNPDFLYVGHAFKISFAYFSSGSRCRLHRRFVCCQHAILRSVFGFECSGLLRHPTFSSPRFIQRTMPLLTRYLPNQPLDATGMPMPSASGESLRSDLDSQTTILKLLNSTVCDHFGEVRNLFRGTMRFRRRVQSNVVGVKVDSMLCASAACRRERSTAAQNCSRFGNHR
jgi:hypothetical protein